MDFWSETEEAESWSGSPHTRRESAGKAGVHHTSSRIRFTVSPFCKTKEEQTHPSIHFSQNPTFITTLHLRLSGPEQSLCK